MDRDRGCPRVRCDQDVDGLSTTRTGGSRRESGLSKHPIPTRAPRTRPCKIRGNQNEKRSGVHRTPVREPLHGSPPGCTVVHSQSGTADRISCLVFSTPTGRILFVGTGHGPWFVLGRDRTHYPLSSLSTFALPHTGSDPDSPREQRTSLPPGDTRH